MNRRQVMSLCAAAITSTFLPDAVLAGSQNRIDPAFLAQRDERRVTDPTSGYDQEQIVDILSSSSIEQRNVPGNMFAEPFETSSPEWADYILVSSNVEGFRKIMAGLVYWVYPRAKDAQEGMTITVPGIALEFKAESILGHLNGYDGILIQAPNGLHSGVFVKVGKVIVVGNCLARDHSSGFDPSGVAVLIAEAGINHLIDVLD